MFLSTLNNFTYLKFILFFKSADSWPIKVYQVILENLSWLRLAGTPLGISINSSLSRLSYYFVDQLNQLIFMYSFIFLTPAKLLLRLDNFFSYFRG